MTYATIIDIVLTLFCATQLFRAFRFGKVFSGAGDVDRASQPHAFYLMVAFWVASAVIMAVATIRS